MTDPRKLRRRWLMGLAVVAVFLLAVWRLENLATLLLLSFLVSYVLNPLVAKLDGIRFISRAAGTVITLLGLFVAVGAVLFVIVPEIFSEFRQFVTKLPVAVEKLQTVAVPWIENTFQLQVPLSLDEMVKQHRQDLDDIASRAIGPVSSILASVFGHTFSAVFAVVGTFMFPLIVFFLLKDFPHIVGSIDTMIPVHHRDNFHVITNEVDKSLSAFLHGQFTVMLILGTLYSVGYSIVGIPVAIGVGLLTGILCFIPYVGAATGFVLALLFSILDYKGIGPIFGVIGVFAGVQILDAVLITPRILGGKLGLRPVWIVVALMAGAELFGFLGVLLAVPSTAVLKVLVDHSLNVYKRSSIYLSEGAESESDSQQRCSQ